MNPQLDAALRYNSEPAAAHWDPARVAALRVDRPHLFAETAVAVAASHGAEMSAFVAAMERVAALPGWQDVTLAGVAEPQPQGAANPGVLYGYDFHVSPAGPRLIEINTNAGGAFLNAHARGDQAMETRLADMFLEEWRLAGRTGMPHTIAIVDETPETQYLAPEFELCAALLRARGCTVCICDPRALTERDGRLCYGETPVDLVYNRLTDFALADAASAPLRQAWLTNSVVLTPHPRHHAVFADKRNLVRLSDADWLAAIGVTPADRALIARVVPETRQVRPEDAEVLWARRKELFFKPSAGFGSRAAYRGDKLTKRVFEEILAGDYVAQALVPPPERVVWVDGAAVSLKYDLRCYAYRGKVLLMAARLWQGQTTNFRTPGGGFADVEEVA